ncbi:hypothetical protein [Candidatus Halobonum tyrrellensis]|uniref:Uncharacterized protein n=1 Tax=Candidatus Halobonum tyrrellensis G22 TaxID=1324957 RepID=V4HHZ5_9EURY|nr:hypothetical protein [Candidatus Halobonum tyrrellensis]ESP89368.1 hypothetical protein K933_05101 [Candidatus Halobonum tyrrellensis G22]
MSSRPRNPERTTSEVVFRIVLVLSATLAVLVLAVFPFQRPGTGSWVVSVLALCVQALLIAVAGVGLYLGWQPLRAFD